MGESRCTARVKRRVLEGRRDASQQAKVAVGPPIVHIVVKKRTTAATRLITK